VRIDLNWLLRFKIVFIQQDTLNVIFNLNYRLEYNNMMLRKIFCSNMETLTEGWRKFQ